ncbi:MAG: hypothetical protein RMJ56_13740 [Gemmataceae bacterium]|nr:hypothetical protein [Gemmata sp.]MDW8198654.1 hypothetical protein [Gemmataceae bacterium]
MDEQLIALYHRHVAAAYDRKLRFTTFVHDKAGRAKWTYDVATATLACGPKLRFEAPLLGTHTHSNDAWVWAWANRHLKLTLTNRALGDLVRVTAHRIGVPMLAHPGLALAPLLGAELTPHAADILGAILSHELGYEAYHIEHDGDHDSVILIRYDKLKRPEPYPLHRVQTLFPQVIDTFTLFDHRAALAAYAHDYGLAVTEVPHGLTISDGTGQLVATFDEHDHLTQLAGTNIAIPPKKPTKKVPSAMKAAAKPLAATKLAATKKPTAPKGTTKKNAPVKKMTAKKSAPTTARGKTKRPSVKKAQAVKPKAAKTAQSAPARRKSAPKR